MPRILQVLTAAFAAGFLCVESSAQTAAPPSATILPTIDVFSSTPLSGSGIGIEKVPAGVVTVDSYRIQQARTPNFTAAIARDVPSVSVSEVSGNSFQPNFEFRGFEASPVAGTPQGLAVYQNGVRINEAFGDTVNWDLIPTIAVRSVDVVANNPAFGLNALGGALSVQMKDGFANPGGTVDVSGGSFGRIQAGAEYGKQVDNFAVYGALEAAREKGFRQRSTSDIRRFYGDIGYKADGVEFHLNGGAAGYRFGATAAAPFELLQQGWGNVYTTPQITSNQMGSLNLTGKVDINADWSVQGVAHVRSFRQRTTDGNATNTQPCAADPTTLCFNDDATPANGPDGNQLNNPYAAGTVLGEIDRTSTRSTTYGATLQTTYTGKIYGHENHFVAGGSLDYGVTKFGAKAEIASIDPSFVTTGSGLFLGASGVPVANGPVDLRATNIYGGLYAVDAFDVTDKLTVTAGGRLNIATIKLDDRLGGALSGTSHFIRFNPMLGATYKVTPDITAYGGYSEANRAPTPLELGCANPAQPCIVASFLVSDPPLKQVVARTAEAGFRGKHDLGEGRGTVNWGLGVFRTGNSNDILNVPSPQLQGFGYFTNIGRTRRQGIEAKAGYEGDTVSLYASYAFTDATFRTPLALQSNSPSADANGQIFVTRGKQIPMIPRHRIKIGGEYSLTPKFKIGADMNYVGAQRFAGDASNEQRKLPAYVVFSLNASYKVTDNIQIYGKIDNLFDRRYYTYGTYFNTASLFGNFRDARTLSPAQPRAIYGGVKATF